MNKVSIKVFQVFKASKVSPVRKVQPGLLALQVQPELLALPVPKAKLLEAKAANKLAG